MEKTRDLFKKIRDIKETFHARIGMIKESDAIFSPSLFKNTRVFYHVVFYFSVLFFYQNYLCILYGQFFYLFTDAFLVMIWTLLNCFDESSG